jgi:hypothetical protein
LWNLDFFVVVVIGEYGSSIWFDSSWVCVENGLANVGMFACPEDTASF